MNTDTIIRLLTNSGFHNVQTDGTNILMEAPSCILRAFETFADYAWFAVTFVTGILIIGWALSMIRGAKNDIFTNLRNLILIFGILSLSGPIINLIYGDDLFARGCDTITVPISQINEMLARRNIKFDTNQYENFDIYDSGVVETPLAEGN
ncbi:MAG: hypothetical protein IJX89_01985 [Alphaproteobacteria bacterium]|nr:hypothetical protein [Alphaproteobacteria bacterium]